MCQISKILIDILQVKLLQKHDSTSFQQQNFVILYNILTGDLCLLSFSVLRCIYLFAQILCILTGGKLEIRTG